MQQKALSLVTGIFCSFLWGCTMAPTYTQPDMPVAGTLPVPAAFSTGNASESSTIPEVAARGWADFYADPSLQELIATALEHNRDLKAAALNVETLQAQYRIQRAELFPEINGGGSWTKQRTLSGGNYVTGEMYGLSVGVTSYELDLFGRVRSLNEDALQQYLAQEETYRGAIISLVAETARAYLSLLSDQQLLTISEDTARNQADVFQLVQQRYDEGISNRMELAQSRTALETAKKNLAMYKLQIIQDNNSLALLAGTSVPNQVRPSLALEDHNLALPLPANLSSQVLLQRPDIRAAEHALLAANANIGAARAAFFPRISLTGSAGYMSPEFSDLFESATGVWAFTPSITVPIFTGGRLSAQLDVAQLRKEVAIVQYEKAIQSAFFFFFDALAAEQGLAEQVAAQRDYVQASQDYYDLAVARYKEGVDSFLVQLDAQRSLFAAKQAYVTLRLAQQNNQVNLYKALGGGWKK